jgi:multidrug efflux pump subunit AcrA (membrane-fusion protein)
MFGRRWFMLLFAVTVWPFLASSVTAQDRYGRPDGGLQTPAPIPPASAPLFPTTTAASPTSAAPTASPPAPTSPGGLPTLPRCVVKIIDEVNVSVQEPGLVVALEIREGMTVEVDTIVGRVNDGQARMNKLIAEAGHHAAARKAQNDVEILHAQDAEKVAEYEYQSSALANQRSPNAVSQIKLNELLLAHQKAVRQIELAKHNREIYKLEAEAKRVEVEAAEDEVRRRQIVAPITGQVTEVPVHVGQYVQPGDTVFRLVRLDRLAVEGLLDASEYAPSEILNLPVMVETTLARGRRAQFVGKVTFVHPEIDNRGKFRIKAEITNTVEAGQFLLFPGKEVDMTLRLDAGPQGATPASPPLFGRDPTTPISR